MRKGKNIYGKPSNSYGDRLKIKGKPSESHEKK